MATSVNDDVAFTVTLFRRLPDGAISVHPYSELDIATRQRPWARPRVQDWRSSMP
jgi:hypothetical protein